MKKKLSIILITLVLAITMIVATACNNDSGMIVKNNERNYTQVTADVAYAGRAAQVDKIELNSAIYNQVYTYYYYYQQGYIGKESYQSMLDQMDTMFKNYNEGLAGEEAYVLKCIDELYKVLQKNGTDKAKAAAAAASTVGKAYDVRSRIAELESVLPLKDLIAAREAYNKEMQEDFDSFRDEYEEEMRKATAVSKSTQNVKSLTITPPWKTTYEKGESLLENGLKVSVNYNDGTTVELDRTDYTVTGFSSDTVKDGVEVTVTFGSTTETFKVNIVTALPSRPKLPTEEEEEDEVDPNLYAADDASKLPKLFEKDIAEQIEAARTTDKSLYNALKEAKFRLEKQMSGNYRTYEYYYLTKLKSQATTAYEEIIGETAQVTDAQVTAEYQKKLQQQLEDLSLVNTKYSDKITSETIKTQIVHEDGETFYVQHVLLKITDDLEAQYKALEDKKIASDEALEKYHNQLIDKTRVRASNVAYDKDAECKEDECTCTACANYTGENPGPCTNPDCTCEKCPNKRFLTKDSGEALKGLVLDEDGTIDINDAVNAIYADLGEVGETALERAKMLEKFKTWIYMLNDDDGFFTTMSDGKPGYCSADMEDTSAGTWDKNFVALAKALANGPTAEEIDKWHIVGTDIGSYGWCHSGFGIHIIMLSGYALPEEYKVDTNKIAGTEYYAVPADGILDYTTYDDTDPENEKVKTLRDGIKETLLEKAKEEKIGEFKKAFRQKEMEESVQVTYYDNYQDLIDQYKA